MNEIEVQLFVNGSRVCESSTINNENLPLLIERVMRTLHILQKEQAHRDYQRADKLLSLDEPKVTKVKLGSIR